MAKSRTIDKIVSKFKNKSAPKPKKLKGYRTSKERVTTALERYEMMKTFKEPTSQKFKELDELYELKSPMYDKIASLYEDLGIDLNPAMLTDAFSQVESAINTSVPSFQFTPADEYGSYQMAKRREQLLEYVLRCNKIEKLNAENERILHKLGTAFFMVRYDHTIKGFGYEGEIVITNPNPANIFIDPSAQTLEDAEDYIYSYPMSRNKAIRTFGYDKIEGLTSDANQSDTEFFYAQNHDVTQPVDPDSFQVIEYYWRDEEGDLAMCTVINNEEVKYIEKYWEKTRHMGNQKFNLICYNLTPRDKIPWGIGDLEMIQGLAEYANKQFVDMLLNNMYMGADIILAKDDAFLEGEDYRAYGGAIWKVKRPEDVKRLGGIANANNSLATLQYIQDQIQTTNGNFASNMGKEPARVTTASGIAQLNERADRRVNIKEVGRTIGYLQLAELVDYMALEFYTDNRYIKVRPKDGQKEEVFKYNSENFELQETKSGRMIGYGDVMLDDALGDNSEDEIIPGKVYYPKMDVQVDVGDGVKRSKAFTMAATQELLQYPITPANHMIVRALVDLLGLPNKSIIYEQIDEAVAMMKQSQQAETQATLNPPQKQAAQPAPGDNDLMKTAEGLLDYLAENFPEQLANMQELPQEQQAQIMDALVGAKSPEEFAEVMQLLA